MLDRFRAVHARFGAPIAEQLLGHFTGELLRRLPPPKKLFRWNPWSVLALLEGEPSAAEQEIQVREALQAIPIEHKVEVGSRTALLMLTHHWKLLPVAAGLPAAVSAHEIEQFTLEEKGLDG